MLTEADIEVAVNHETIVEYLNGGISRLIAGHDTEIARISSDKIELRHVKSYLERVSTFEEATATSRFAIRSYTWAKAFLESARSFAVGDWDGKFTHSGITYQFSGPQRNSLFKVARDAMHRELSSFVTPIEDAPSWYVLSEPRMGTNYIGDPDVGILNRAVWMHRRQQLIVYANNYNAAFYGAHTINGVMHQSTMRIHPTTPDNLVELQDAFVRALSSKPNANELYLLRSRILEQQQERQVLVDTERRAEAGKRFELFWSSMKQTRQPQDLDSATMSWSKLPLAASGTESSRTWGIEIETERADETSRPSGWRSEYDGSLLEGGCDTDYCDCGCDSCYDNDYGSDHCHDCGSDCHYRCDPGGNESREFVSPILRAYNSAGLRHLCDDLGTRDDETSRAGIHVHIGAEDLSVFDVTRLLVAYSAIEHLLEPIYHRKARNYCKTMTTDQLRWWLSELRTWRKTNPAGVPTPSQVIRQSSGAAPDRYVDVNLQALNEHGTIEFRAMGAWYDYDHLVRWAWLLRELVNVSKLGIDQQQWTACRTIDDVVALLRKYGTEMPSNKLFAEVSPAGSEMSGDEE